MSELLSRDNEIYMRIENFEDYEFTNCIAYEMEQRSLGINPIEIQKNYQNDSKGYIVYGFDLSHIKLSSRCSVADYIFNIFPSLYDDLFKKLKNEYINSDNDKLKYKIMEMPIPIKYIIDEYLKKEDVIFNEIIYYTDEGKRDYLTKEKLLNLIRKTNYVHQIKSNFKYKDFIHSDFKFVTLDNLNLALPKKELVAYISKIKDDFDKNKLILDTPSEIMMNNYVEKKICTLIDAKLKRHEKIDIFTKSGKKKSEFSPYTILDSKKNTADMFYIYDHMSLNFSKKDILEELEKYHNTFDVYRFDCYLKFAEKFIDGDAYENLIK